jgi:phosphoribosylformylglycinamidine synthase
VFLQERDGLLVREGPSYKLTFAPELTTPAKLTRSPSSKPRMAVVRQEGSNGDREMVSAFFLAGFDVWDINMHDLLAGNVSLADPLFRGIAFCGGFSYADVNDSAKVLHMYYASYTNYLLY